MITCAIFSMYHMVINDNMEYIILPIGIVIWGGYKFFRENDRDFLIGHGINPDDINAFFPDYDVDYKRHNIHTNANNNTWKNEYNSSRKQSSASWWNINNSEYKTIIKKCKRNFKITVENGKEIK